MPSKRTEFINEGQRNIERSASAMEKADGMITDTRAVQNELKGISSLVEEDSDRASVENARARYRSEYSQAYQSDVVTEVSSINSAEARLEGGALEQKRRSDVGAEGAKRASGVSEIGRSAGQELARKLAESGKSFGEIGSQAHARMEDNTRSSQDKAKKLIDNFNS